ncbi:ABC transporter G family member 17-like protein [Cinnamomum micranthum f. kanehirae]|uniref:ABC transporter G family member STR2 n=1 Tax=Cinnamomum micranthum f. kanehirae TaxID=337451 RepID=A0A443N6D4_9MAGN|nr:ABC transporter G family member 17-like protein [Cinnamomum micranthum f. kanehirae]
MADHEGHGNSINHDAVIDIIKPSNFTGGLEFSTLTYTVTKKEKIDDKWTTQDVDLLHRITGYAPKGCVTAVMGPSGAGKSTFLDGLAGRIASGSLKGRVSLDGTEISPSLIKRTSAYIMQDDRLFPMLTVYETLMFAADFRLGPISPSDKRQRVEKLIEQLGLGSSRNTLIGDEGTRGVSGGERRRVSIGVDIIHGPSLLFLDEPTSGLDSTSAQSVIDKVHHIARTGSTVILTIHQPSHRILMLLDHLIVLARGELMFQGSPKDVTRHLGRMGRKVPKGGNSIEYLLDVIREYDQSELGVRVLADFCLTGMKPPPVTDEMSISSVAQTPSSTVARTPSPFSSHQRASGHSDGGLPVKRLHLNAFDHSVRSPWGASSKSPWSGTHSGVMETIRFTPSRNRSDKKPQNPALSSLSFYASSNEILSSTPTPHSSDYTVDEIDYLTPSIPTSIGSRHHYFGAKFANPYFSEIWVLMRRNFTNIRRTPELFLSRQMVLTIMGVMMATMFMNPKDDMQGLTNRLSFFIFTVCLFFFSSNDAVPAFIQERYIFVRETSHNAYRASCYTIAGLITYLPFLAVQAGTYAGIVWFALGLRGPFLYFLLILYASLLSTNSFVVFVSSVVPTYILGYAAVIAFTALFFLFCGYFLNSHDIPKYWKWMNNISTMKYPYEGLLMNQFQSTHIFMYDPKGNAVTGNMILQQMSISRDERDKWNMVIYLLGWAVFYRVLFYFVLRFFSKNQRT